MEKIKVYLTSVVISLGLIIICDFFINILNYFDLLSISVYKVLIVLFSGVSILIGSFFIGRKTKEKGYIEGIKFGLIICLIMFLISLIVSSFNTSSLIYYPILIIFSIFGSMIGINKKELDN